MNLDELVRAALAEEAGAEPDEAGAYDRFLRRRRLGSAENGQQYTHDRDSHRPSHCLSPDDLCDDPAGRRLLES